MKKKIYRYLGRAHNACLRYILYHSDYNKKYIQHFKRIIAHVSGVQNSPTKNDLIAMVDAPYVRCVLLVMSII